ncbi:RNA12 protein-domain-containing protein [Mycena olivaceomarginata]|nr:RNA12 protein-domain-containing protein [Mycena olivaceomarginata]
MSLSIRWHFAYLQEKYTLDAAHSFTVLDVQPRHVEGGVFVAFEFIARDEEAALRAIDAELEREAETRGRTAGLARRVALPHCQGQPWMEVNVDSSAAGFTRGLAQVLIRTCAAVWPHPRHREPFPAPAGSLRWASVVFDRTAAAAVARSAIHGLEGVGAGAAAPTTLRISYGQHLDGHKIREWIFKHPRIAFPIVIFVVTGYSIYGHCVLSSVDAHANYVCPLPRFSIPYALSWCKPKLRNGRRAGLYQWIRAKSAELRIFPPRPEAASSAEEVWKERKQAEAALRTYLTESPSTIAFVHGPQGSGKSHLLDNALKDSRRKTLVIDCRPLQNATSDTQLMTVLASQPAFGRSSRPSAPYTTSSTSRVSGSSGKKRTSAARSPSRCAKMLAVVRRSLKHVKSSPPTETESWRNSASATSAWEMTTTSCSRAFKQEEGCEAVDTRRKQKSNAEIAAVDGLPIVVLRNFDARGSNRGEIYDVLAEVGGRLGGESALPSKPLNTIALHDADAASALAFVKRKLEDADIDLEYTREQVASVERLGGRATDLENVGIPNPQGSQRRYSGGRRRDIIYREVNEVRKKAFGDDAEDAKNLPWGREQAWALFKLLSKNSEIPYHEVLLEFPFKGDEAPLRNMEHAELISIGTHNGRPSTIRPGKPVFRAVFERLVNDSIFQATQDIAFNEKVIAAAEGIVKACELELLSLKDIEGGWWGNAASSTHARIGDEDRGSGRQNSELKKVLAKGG